MTTDLVSFVSRETLFVVAYVCAPVLGIALVVGLAVGIFQAITSIQEMTLTFIPKILAVGIVLLILTNWFLDLLVNYTELIFSEISKM
ncbi:flagellar biosynthetic protein FliQ [bacterium]|jgi:flagellar biosynthetic protein FliQ|nr:MAG: flagellar biosynthetic protein FliQ [bacterium]|tara:strand:- start:218 stop:481 length:264 start_codon:yes stop_codon:yes gene_type:complete